MRWVLIAQAMLFSAFLVCGTALAQGTTPTPVNGFVIINPISVCSGGSCAPYGVSCTSTSGAPVCTKSPAPSLATAKTPIGFVDADTNINLTRAFWAQAGIDVVFFPVQSYNSPSNIIPSSWNNIKDAVSGLTLTSATGGNWPTTTYQTLHLVNVQCADTFVALTSPDFQALTQHPICTEHGGLATAYQKLVNPPPSPSPVPPLAINGCSTALPCSPNSNAIDVFFVNGYSGTSPALSNPQYGFSWINGDGVSVQQAIFTTSALLKTAPRYDTLAHEIGHALGLSHMNFGLPLPSTTTGAAAINNLMQLGTTRATSYTSGCLGTSLNPPINDFNPGPPPIYNNGALYDLDLPNSNPCGTAGTQFADQVILQPVGASSACPTPLDPNTCITQEGAVALSPFINKTAPSNANSGGGLLLANAATTSTTSSTAVQLTISASGDPNDPNVPDLASTIIALPPSDPLSFNGNQPVTQIGGTGCVPNNVPNGCVVTIARVTKLTNQQVTGNPGCDSGTGQPPSSQCIKIDYNPGFRPGDNIVLAVQFNKDSATIINNGLLAGAQYTSIDANGFSTTSLFVAVPTSATAPNFTGITADSQHPDLATPNVLVTASTFQNAAAVNLGPILSKCTSDAYITVKIRGKLVQVCKDGNLPGGPD